MLSEIKSAFRSLMRAPGLTAVVIVTLALGIGANAAIFSMVRAVLLSPIPYAEPSQLVFLWEKSAKFDFAAISWPNLQDWRARSQSFVAMGGFRRQSFKYVDDRGPERVTGMQAEAALLEALHVSPMLGRLFTHDEDRAGAASMAVLSQAFWQRRFNGDRGVIGRTLNLDGRIYTVIGVMPPDVQLSSQLGLGLLRSEVDVWTQLGPLTDGPEFQDRQNHPGVLAVGRLKPGVSYEQAMTELRSISGGIKQEHPELAVHMDAAGAPLLEKAVEGYESLWLLQAAVALVLLIACANIAILLAARGIAREPEFAVRAALGASPRRLMQPLLMESLLLACAGGALGLLVAYWVHGAIGALNSPATVVLARTHMDVSTFVGAGLLSLVTAVIFGLWPMRKAARPNLQRVLQEGGRTNAGGGAAGTRSLLIAGQIALTTILLAGSGLILKSFMQAQSQDLGFQPHGLVTARLELPKDAYGSPQDIHNFTERLLARVQALPGVRSADIAATLPLQSGSQSTYEIDGQASADGSQPFAEVNVVSDDYFRTMKIPLLRGRMFGREDSADGQLAVIIDEAAAARHWPDRDPIGNSIRMNDSTLSVVGVVPTVRLHGYAREPLLLQAYLSSRQNPIRSMSLAVRTDRDPAAVASAVRGAVQSIDPAQPVWDISTFDDRIAGSVSNMRLYTLLFGIFAALALLLAMLGIYGLLAFQVACQTREFGIRIALGARHRQIVWQVVSAGIRLLAAGAAVGVIGALLAGRTLNALLYHTSPVDPVVLGSVLILLSGVALLACWLPARRVMKVDPIIALRAE